MLSIKKEIIKQVISSWSLFIQLAGDFILLKLATLKIVMFGTFFHKCGMFCMGQHPGVSLYFLLHSLSFASYLQQILHLSRCMLNFKQRIRIVITRLATFVLLQ